MILKYISIPELNLSSSWKIGWGKIQKFSKLDRYMTIFWFLGPFIYLIERDPADLWLTLIGLVFLIRSFVRKEWNWSKQIWFKLAIAFWLSSLVSASLSLDPIYSLSQGIPWIRFPLYAAAAQAWLGKHRDLRLLMFISIIFGLLIMNGILLAETIVEPKLRLSWPYGDTIPGVYIAKLGLPIIGTLLILNLRKANFLSFVFIIFSITMTLLTGERTHFVLLVCACFLCSIFWSPRFFNYFIFFITVLSIIIGVSLLRPNTTDRLISLSTKIVLYTFKNENTHYLVNNNILTSGTKTGPVWDKRTIDIKKSTAQINTYMSKFMTKKEFQRYNSKTLPDKEFNEILERLGKFKRFDINSYWGAWRGGIQQGLDRPVLGIGPSNTRKTCKNLANDQYEWLPGKNYCGNHPHNFYIQMFAETGLIGLFLGTLMIISIIMTCYKARKHNASCPMLAIAFIIPLGLFFPLQQFGSFFGQWGNLFIWFAVGFAMSQVQNFNIKNNFKVIDD